MKKNKSESKGYLSLFIIFVGTFLITFPAGFVTRAALDPWYYNLVKPAFNPPNWIFGPVWTLLYAMMSVAVWLAYKKSKNSNKILAVYFIHLLINASCMALMQYNMRYGPKQTMILISLKNHMPLGIHMWW